MISSLDELSVGCVDENARTQIREAIGCYQVGAYRAAIVTAYIAVCFDLIQKLKSLAAAGDAEAMKAVQELENLQSQNNRKDPNAINGLLEFERGLLERFRDNFDFFGSNEFDEIERLRTDRNRCAHPTFLKNSQPFAPSAELARLHIRNAVTLVLSQPPRQGKAALDSLQSLVLSSYFPEKVSDAVARLKGSEILNARRSLIIAFVDLLCFGYPDRGSPLHQKSAVNIALRAIIEMNRAEALPRLIQNMNKLLMETESKAVEYGCVLALGIDEAGLAVNESGRPIVKHWLKSRKGTIRGSAVKKALALPWLRDEAIQVASELKSEDFAEVTGKIPPEIISSAARLYASAQNWTQANEYASRFAIDYANKFSEQDLDHIFSEVAAKRADLIGSHGFDEFIDALLSQDVIRKNQAIAIIKKHKLARIIPSEEDEEEDPANSTTTT